MRAIDKKNYGYSCSDLGNAQRLYDLADGNVRWVGAWKSWVSFEGPCWRRDESGAAMRYAMRLPDVIENEINDVAKQINMLKNDIKSCDNSTERSSKTAILDEREKKFDSLVKWKKASGSHRKMNDALQVLASFPDIPATPDLFDSDPLLFGCANGLVNLKTGEFTSFNNNTRLSIRDRFIMQCSHIKFDMNAGCPRFLRFLSETFGIDCDIERVMQRILGYSTTALTREQLFFILHGSGANGKSVLMSVVSFVLGDYARTAPPNTFMIKKNESPGFELDYLGGARLVRGDETGQGKHLDESLMKQLTGGDRISTRQPYCLLHESAVRYKIFILTNHVPRLSAADEAMRRRWVSIPFKNTVPAESRDKNLFESLKSEAAGILNWLLEGARQYLDIGLAIPPEISEERDSFFLENDVYKRFFKDCCKIDPEAFIDSRLLYTTFIRWAESEGEDVTSNGKPPSQAVFTRQLRDRGFPAIRKNEPGSKGWAKTKLYQGVTLSTDGWSFAND